MGADSTWYTSVKFGGEPRQEGDMQEPSALTVFEAR